MNQAAAWNANLIAGALARQFFNRKHLVVVPECNWTGHECDLLVVTTDLRVIDVEIKTSRADLRRDAAKDKWWHYLSYQEAQDLGLGAEWGHTRETRRSRLWPPKVWKHYLAVPKDIWDDSLFEALPSPASGVLLLERRGDRRRWLVVQCQRRATPNRDAKKISADSAIDIARLASLRMWDSYDRLAEAGVAP